jgi:preprotein translocase subunit SecA
MQTGRLLAIDGALAHSVYPERQDKAQHAADRWVRASADGLRRRLSTPARREIAQLRAVQATQGAAHAALSDEALRRALGALAGPAVHGLQRVALHQALPLLAEAAQRTLGLRPYAVQLFGAATLLRGRLAEMQTGEGKTLTAGLAACLAALAGVPVHVVTVNDYLAGRDAATLTPLFSFFGLRAGVVVHGIPPDAKRAAYACDITYCTNKELVFDYLRDRASQRGRTSALRQQAGALFQQRVAQPLLRGLHLAIVDEADSILIDEARTPLILAEKAGPVGHAEAFAPALAIAAQLQAGTHFLQDRSRRELHLTAAGRTAGQRARQPLARGARAGAPGAAGPARAAPVPA